jgi:hypothetical protein
MDYNIIIMTHIVKVQKYHHSVHLPECYRDIEVTNASTLHDNTYVVTTHRKYPILKFHTKEGRICSEPMPVKGFSNTKIKFLGFIKDRIAVIPKHTWNICVLREDSLITREKSHRTYESVTIDSHCDLKHKIIEKILCRHPRLCKHEDCYHLVGFVNYQGFNLFVQLSCSHHSENHLLFVIKANLDMATLECTDMEVTNEYNYHRLCIDHGIHEKNAKSSHFTSVYYKDNKVFLVSTNGKEGYLWEMSYFTNISYLGPPVLVCKLRRHPRGVYIQGDAPIVICGDSKCHRLTYYAIDIERRKC